MDGGDGFLSGHILERIRRFEDLRILVWGDFLLDQFVYGEISRVSREAPVLILKYADTLTLPGGAANTVANVCSLGATAIPAGFIGDDEAGEQLFSVWPAQLDTRCVFRQPDFRTTRKQRILAGSFHSFRQQVVRIDHESVCRLEPSQEDRMESALRDGISQVDAVIISDYSLGNVTQRLRRCVLEEARAQGRLVVVDSRDDPGGYPGATTATPNITEAESAAGQQIGGDLERLEKIGSELRKRWRLDSLLITRGRHGMSLFEDGTTTHVPIHGSDEVADVTGAGDTVTATYTTALAAGASPLEAARLANLAGGLVVMKRGTGTVSQAEIRKALPDSADLGDAEIGEP